MTTETAPLVTPVTAQHKRALRTADSIVFRLHDGQSTIEATRDGKNTADGFDQRVSVYCETVVIDYSGYMRGDAPKIDQARLTGVHSDHGRPTGQTATMIDLLSTGATVTLEWTRGNDNENNRSIGWVRDELRVSILPANSKTPRVLLIDVQVGPDNSARMITAR